MSSGGELFMNDKYKWAAGMRQCLQHLALGLPTTMIGMMINAFFGSNLRLPTL